MLIHNSGVYRVAYKISLGGRRTEMVAYFFGHAVWIRYNENILLLLVHCGAGQKPPNQKYWNIYYIIIPMSITVLSYPVFPNWRKDKKNILHPHC